jgi:hypothetical protein
MKATVALKVARLPIKDLDNSHDLVRTTPGMEAGSFCSRAYLPVTKWPREARTDRASRGAMKAAVWHERRDVRIENASHGVPCKYFCSQATDRLSSSS